MQNANSFNESLASSIGLDGGSELIGKIADLSLQNIVDSELIKKIPIVSTVVSIWKIGSSISDH